MHFRTLILSLLFILLLLGLMVGLFVWHQISQMEPNYEGEWSIAGLEASVSISLDSVGVAHIVARQEKDAIIAQGFWVASERLWQMELMRRAGAGRLTEVFGDTARKADLLFQTLGLDSLVREWYPGLSPQSQNWLSWYATGVNAYIESCQGNFPLEFQILGLEPEPWLPEHSLLVGRVMAWILNFSWKADFLYWRLAEKLSPRLVQDLWPRWGRDLPSILAQLPQGSNSLLSLWEMDESFRSLLNLSHGGWGSNSWVVSGQLTRSGKPLLANDPHLELQNPPIWYALQLQCPEFRAAGVCIPGIPGITIGRNQAIAWGFTNGMVDDSDYFIESVDTTALVYRVGRREHPLRVRHVVWGEPGKRRSRKIFETRHGPLFQEVLSEYQSAPPVAFQWTGRMPSDELLAFWKLIRARDWEAFRDALSHYRVPAQNVVYADLQGNIGYQLAGGVPRRPDGQGLLPRQGASEKQEWQGFIPFQRLPHRLNPEEGFLVTANNQIVPNPPFYITELWEPPFRAQRIEQLLKTLPRPLSVEEMRTIQADIVNLPGKWLAEQIVAHVSPGVLQGLLEKPEDMFFLLEQWDGRMDARGIAPSIVETTQWFLIRNIFLDEMGPSLFRLFTRMPNFYVRIFYQVLSRPTSPWFDDVSTPEVQEDLPFLLEKSLRQAVEQLQSELGDQMYQWEWGKLHTFTYAHPMGSVIFFRHLLNRGPYPADGNVATVNVSSYRYEHPFRVFAGPSMRMIVDWATPQRIYLHWPGGNSGNPFSPFFDNLLAPWRKVALLPVDLSGSHEARYRFTLVPE